MEATNILCAKSHGGELFTQSGISDMMDKKEVFKYAERCRKNDRQPY